MSTSLAPAQIKPARPCRAAYDCCDGEDAAN